MRLLLVGYGRMGKLVERLAPDYGFQVVGRLDDTNNIGAVGIPTAPDADVAVDFSIPSAVAENLPKLAERRINVVIGTTGWQEHEPEMRRVVSDAGIGVVAAPNFSLGWHCSRVLLKRPHSDSRRTRNLGCGFTKSITPRRRMRHRGRQSPCSRP